MQNDISNKVRLLLNELAILNQPDVLEGKFFYSPNTLARLKQLSAELYLLTDQLLAAGVEAVAVAVKEEEKSVTAEMVVPEPSAPVVESIPEVEEPAEVVEEVAEPATPPVIDEVKVPPPAAEAPTTIPEKVIPPSNHHPVSDLFEGKISFTRRFEYVNNLFGGDGAAFSLFLKEIAGAEGREGAMNIFESAFEQRNWKRKSETSDDLKQLIKKVK